MQRAFSIPRARRRAGAAALGLITAASTMAAVPASAFDAPINPAPGDSSMLSGDSNGRFGSTVVAADADGDGVEDLIVINDNYGGGDGTILYVYLGTAGPFTDVPLYEDGLLGTGVEADIVIDGIQPSGSGAAVGVGDFDGDGQPEIAFTAAASVRTFTTPAPGYYDFFDVGASQVTNPGSGNATSLAVGDLDENSIDDLAIGWPDDDEATIHFGAAPTPSVTITGTAASRFGASVAIGTFIDSQTGAADVAVGAPDTTVGWSAEGAVYGFSDPAYGSSVQTLADAAVEILGDEDVARLGTSVLVDDVNGDGAEDLVAGAPGGLGGSGFVMPALGTLPSGTSTVAAVFDPWIAPGGITGFGRSLATGDVDASDTADLAAGADDAVVVRSSDETTEWIFTGTSGSWFGATIAIIANELMAVGAPYPDGAPVLGSVELFATTTAPSSGLVVDTTGDGPDVAPGDGQCLDADGTCSLRAAIEEANASGGGDITFAIAGAGPHAIQVSTPLPDITSTITIDGDSQPGNGDALTSGALRLGIRSSIATPNTDGIVFAAGSDLSAIRGLAISGFTGSAIRIESDGVTVRNMRLGIRTSEAGSVANQAGLSITGTNALVEHNLISNNTNVGVDILAPGANLRDNRIGTSVDGESARPNDLGVNVAPTAGFVDLDGNLISGNASVGVQIKSGTVAIRSNEIGVTPTGAALGNGAQGILAAPSAGDTVDGSIGGNPLDSYNTIANNGAEGVGATGDVQVAIVGNRIFDNGGLGIDLGSDGPTPNDAGDADNGANDLLNAPIISDVSLSGASSTATLDLDVPPGDYRLQLFANTACDPSGAGEGRRSVATLDASGGPGFQVPVTFDEADLAGNTVLSATATRLNGFVPEATSEFADCVDVSSSSTATIANLALEVDRASSGPGITGVPITDIPIEAVLEAAAERNESASPLSAIPLSAIDLQASPLSAIPLSAIPLSAIPLSAIPLSAIPLSAIPLSAIYVGDTGNSWDDLLVGTEFEGRPANTVSLDELLAVAPVGHPLLELGLADVDLSATPLSAISTSALLLGDLDLRVELAEVCADAAASGIPCTDARNTLVALEADGYDVSASPLSAIPLSAIPLSAIPLSAIPLSAIPLSAIPLSAIPLSAIPLSAIELGATPLSAIDIGAIPLSAIPLSAIPLSAIPLSAIPLSAIPLSAIELEGTDLGDTPLSAIEVDGRSVCQFLTAAEANDAAVLTCAELGLNPGATVHELATALELAGSSLASSPLSAIPLSAIPLSAIPLSAIDLTDVPLSAIPLSAIPLSAIPLSAIELQGTPLSAIPLSAIDLEAGDVCSLLDDAGAGDPDAVTCDDLSADPTVYELAVALEAAGGSLADEPIGSIPLSAIPLSAIVIDLADASLSDLFDGADSLADLPESVLAELDLAEILFILAGTADYPWEDLDLVALGVQDFVPTATTVTYTARFDVAGAGPGRVVVTLPRGYRYRATTTLLGGVAAPEPVVTDDPDGQILTWSLDLVDGTAQELRFDVSPGFTLTTSGSDARVVAANLVGVTNQAPHTVIAQDGNDAVDADVLQIGYITTPAESDVYSVTTTTPGNSLSVFLGHQSSDVDLVMYKPLPAAPAGSDDVGLIYPQPIEEDTIADVLDGGSETDSLGDVPADPGAAVVESSASRGTGTETAEDLDLAGGTRYEIEVTGYNKNVSVEPYLLRVVERSEIEVPVCDPIFTSPTPDLAATTALSPGLETIVVFDKGRASTVYDAAEADRMEQAALDLVGYLNQAGNDFGAAEILYTDGLTDYSAWDLNPCDWKAADDVAKAIREPITDYQEANTSLRYVTIVGGDDIIPFHRQVDATAYANEASFAAEYSRTTSPALYGAAITRHLLTDHPYGDPSPDRWLDRFLYLPTIAVGRLIEDADDIESAVATFVGADGTLDPSTGALVTGYDFLANGADETAAALSAGYTVTAEIGETWTDDTIEAVLSPAAGQAPDLLSINAHFDPYRALPAAEQKTADEDYDQNVLWQVDDLAGVDLERAWLLTMGCHAGVSELDVTLGRTDWAQSFVGGGGLLTGNTGYGYGDTVTVALTEEIVAGIAQKLSPADWEPGAPRSIGQAVVDALNAYSGEAGLYGVYDEKAIQEFTTYGLPMYQIDIPTTSTGTPSAAVAVTADPLTGLPVGLLSTAPSPTREESVYGSYWTIDGQTLDIHYRPIQPMTSLDVSVEGLTARGALITAWTSTDIAVADVAYARPIIDDSDREKEIEDDTALFPSVFATVSSYEQTSPTPGRRTEQRQNLNLILGQYDAATDTQRLFSDVEAEVLYVSDDAAVDNVPASIRTVQAVIVDDQASFIVDVDDATPAARVVVLYRPVGAAQWASVDLQANSPWSGSVAVPNGTTEVEYLVQVARENGLVATSSSKGEFHRAEPATTELPATPELTVTVDGQQTQGWYTGVVTVDADGTSGPFTVNVDDTQASLPVTLSDSGAHVVVLTDADGNDTTFVIPIDNSAPEAAVSMPASVDQGDEVVVSAGCRDSGSGLASCVITVDGTPVTAGSLLDTSSPGSRQIVVTATDVVGNTTSGSATITVVGVVVPTLGATVSPDAVTLGEPVSLTAAVIDGDVAGWTLDWGDGTVETSAAAATLDAEHTYLDAGSFDVSVTAALLGGDELTTTAGTVTVTDVVTGPASHRLSAAGRYFSPPGSWTANPTVSGHATFGLHLRYRDEDDTAPTGVFSMRFGAAGLRFSADEWTSLITDAGTIREGGTAAAEGIGRIRGRAGDVHVLIEAADTGIGRHRDSDTIRVVLTDVATDVVLYDSGAADVRGAVLLVPVTSHHHHHHHDDDHDDDHDDRRGSHYDRRYR